MRPHWNRLPIIGAVLLCFLLLMNPGIYCQSTDTEKVNNDQVYGYTPVLWKQTTQADFQSGTTAQTDVTGSPGNVVLSKATGVAPTVFALVGGDSASFYYYLESTDAWTKGANAPDIVSDGGRITSDGQQYVYALQGGGHNLFWRFDVYTNTWTTLANTLGAVSAGSDLQFSGGKLYALQGGGNSAVWIYDISTSLWSTLAISGTLYAMNAGSCIEIVGDYLYAFRPNTPYFMRIAKTGGTWSSSASDVTQPDNHSGPGSEMSATSSSSITVLFGGGTKTFKTYSTTSRTWSSLPNAPNNVNGGGGLTYQPANSVLTNPSYFSLIGGDTTSFRRFTTSDNRWHNMHSVPVKVDVGGGLTYVYSSISQYLASGYFTSSVHDNGRAGEIMNSIIWDATIPSSANQNVIIKVRVSNTLLSGVPNAPWTTVVSQPLTSGTSTFYASLSGHLGQYIQFRVDMSTLDVTVTPSLNEVRLYSRGI